MTVKFYLKCDQLCGKGKQSRKVTCYRKMDKKISVLNDDDCDTEKPDTEKSCNLRPCEGVDWVTSVWSGVRKINSYFLINYYYCY